MSTLRNTHNACECVSNGVPRGLSLRNKETIAVPLRKDITWQVCELLKELGIYSDTWKALQFSLYQSIDKNKTEKGVNPLGWKEKKPQLECDIAPIFSFLSPGSCIQLPY